MAAEKIDVKGKMCPMPVALTKRKLLTMTEGQLLEVIGEGELEFDNIQRWVRNNGHEIKEATFSGGEFKIVVKRC
jgi:tRNA 2-thiouridine synthesizing protein A